MPKVTYHIIEHDGGWAYRVGDVISETFQATTSPERLRSAPRASSGSPATRGDLLRGPRWTLARRNGRRAEIAPTPTSRKDEATAPSYG